MREPIGSVPGTASPDDPLWYKDAIIYQAHVKAFFDSTEDGIGDFPGLTRKLDYLQSLGITCLWLLPFFPSPLKDDGYDIADYRDVHPSYGTLDDFTSLVKEAHARGIRVLIELVINHTSDQHPWFELARNAPAGSPERNFYVWSDTDKKFPETRIIFCDTEKSNWSYDPVAKQYYWHRFFSHQPDLNHDNPAVVEAVIDVMKFWLDLGVDALRLDAVPYLCVREGTNNENLPETHQVLKRMRRELDAAYTGRMLLAEANQWPADVRPYFGDGDECHMAFHFPLMPRMFMALRQEDRHAITEIMSQTPEIPAACQWALFLRNHDELTLEMVTDEERDYMYRSYAADPLMRLNVGIRRRLAPLMENSRARVELLNSLLFSMPGTPVIYYGDEIGMGDNIYLGDRNGVRTPMQWNGDRNGGFSRANPERLYAPIIMDAVYGYQALNVEAQERYAGSLLNWMKRLIAMRRKHRVLGRGSLEFVGCQNRKILAYVRRDEEETLLIVANLSGTVQPAEIDLSAFAGRVPVEMIGLSEFHRITKQPYVLTLGPHAAYWFSLTSGRPANTQVAASEPADPNTAIAEALPALLVGTEWEGVFDSATRETLERQALAPFLRRQRWFASKSREIKQVWFSDWTRIRGGAVPSFITMVSLTYADGWGETYLVPLAFQSGDEARRILRDSAGLALARVTGARKGLIVDGMADDDTCNRLLDLAGHAVHLPTARGDLQGVATSKAVALGPERHWTRGSGEQSNTVAFVDGRYVMKLFRRIEPGLNPDYEIARHLTAEGFTRVPALAGAIEYRRSGLEPGTLVSIQEAIKHQGSGWDFTLDELRRFYERVTTREGRHSRRSSIHTLSTADRWYLNAANALGRRTAELHVALADSGDAAFKPEPLGRTELKALGKNMTAHGTRIFDLLEDRLAHLAEPSRAQAQAVLSVRSTLLARFKAVQGLKVGGLRIRTHGDYHLGQVLRTEEDFVILDFEGEPSRPLEERRLKQSPLRDVAGMIRSFSYAAYAGLFAWTTHSPTDDEHLAPWADVWRQAASDEFLAAYRETLGRSALLPDGPVFDTLLGAFMLEKALYELGYELNNRPDWVRIPLTGILQLK